MSVAAFAALARARADMVETHKRLSEAKIQVGLRTFAVGEVPKPAEERGEGRHLQAVV